LQVVSGAITTFGSGFFLSLTQLTFFTKFSVLIMITIFSSIVIALCFFMPAMVLLGPQGTCGDLQAMFCAGKSTVVPEDTASTQPDADANKSKAEAPGVSAGP
jgi:hypothetical protein